MKATRTAPGRGPHRRAGPRRPCTGSRLPSCKGRRYGCAEAAAAPAGRRLRGRSLRVHGPGPAAAAEPESIARRPLSEKICCGLGFLRALRGARVLKRIQRRTIGIAGTVQAARFGSCRRCGVLGDPPLSVGTSGQCHAEWPRIRQPEPYRARISDLVTT